MNIKTFVCNDFYENSYILYDDSKECIIIDPGCNTYHERKEMSSFIENNGLIPKHLVNTHCHIDHILGNQFIHTTYGLPLEAHKNEIPVLEAGVQVSTMYGIPYDISPSISSYLDEGEYIRFGNTSLSIIFTPGHSPGSISLFQKENNILICGDVLFHGSIGRTDLPGGNYDTLITTIQTKLFTLDDNVVVYSGHGDTTTIGYEKRTNPFFQK